MALTKVTGQVINDTTGLVVGVTTVGGGLSATDGFFSGIVTFSNSVSVAGTLTYEDVTNIDSVGLITARNGIVVGASPGVAASISVDGNMIVSGVTTFNGSDVLVGTGISLSKDGDASFTGIVTFTGADVLVGTGISLSKDGDASFTGIVTATTFKGDGSQLSNITSTTINSNADNRVITGSDTANTLNGESNQNIVSGNLIAGHTASTTVSDGEAPFIQVKSTDSRGGISLLRHSADASGGGVYIGKSRNGTIGSNTIVQDDDELGRVTFSGDDGNDIHTQGAAIKAHIDGTPGSNNMPGRLSFHTNGGDTGVTERMRISKEGYVTKPNLPAFFANASPSHSNFTGYDNSVHSFGNVHYNNGSHYNNSTGRFTAPVAGFYWFSAGIWSGNSDENSGTYLLVLARQDSDASNELQFAGCNHRFEKVQLMVTAGIDMTAGQTVRLWHNGSRIASTPRNFFSGYLVG